MSFLGDLLKSSFPLILEGVKTLADSAVKGQDLTKSQKQILYTGYVAIKVHGDELVESTENPYDNQGLKALAEFAADTLGEAGITVPAIPDELASI